MKSGYGGTLINVDKDIIFALTLRIIFIIIFIVPLGIGILGIVLPSFDIVSFASISEYREGWWWAFSDTFAQTGFIRAVLRSIIIALVTTGISTFTALLFFSYYYEKVQIKYFYIFVPLMLALPHTSLASGSLLLFGEVGWFSALLHHVDYNGMLKDTLGLLRVSLDAHSKTIFTIIVLSMKETLFLLFILAVMSSQLGTKGVISTGISLGYSSQVAWIKLVMPVLYKKIRPAIAAVLVYSLSSIDIPLLIQNELYPTLSLLIWKWSHMSEVRYSVVYTSVVGIVLII